LPARSLYPPHGGRGPGYPCLSAAPKSFAPTVPSRRSTVRGSGSAISRCRPGAAGGRGPIEVAAAFDLAVPKEMDGPLTTTASSGRAGCSWAVLSGLAVRWTDGLAVARRGNHHGTAVGDGGEQARACHRNRDRVPAALLVIRDAGRGSLLDGSCWSVVEVLRCPRLGSSQGLWSLHVAAFTTVVRPQAARLRWRRPRQTADSPARNELWEKAGRSSRVANCIGRGDAGPRRGAEGGNRAAAEGSRRRVITAAQSVAKTVKNAARA
jgi:hypothetical protein